MLYLYFSTDPNPLKVVAALEEMELTYQIKSVNLLRGEQHSPEFRHLNPNGKVPVLIDGPIKIFDSSAILIYLSEKTGKLGGIGTQYAEILSWLMFVASGVGPFLGQAIHFRHFSAEDSPYARNRYIYEANRHCDILEERLQHNSFLAGDTFSIADIAAWPWMRLMAFALGDDTTRARPHIERYIETVEARPAIERSLAVKEAYEIDHEIDDAARAFLFPHINNLAQ